MNHSIRNLIHAGLAVALVAAAAPAPAIDSDLYQRYQAYKARQQVGQGRELAEARAAALAGNLDQAEQHLAAARNMAYAPTEVAAVEQLITAERSQREQLAREERQRREADERARVQAAQVAASGDAGSSGSGSSNAVDYGMDWGYDTHDIYVPPEYQSELKYRQYFTFREYYWETTETRPGYSYQSYDKVYFSVHLKNNASRPVNVVQTGMWALAGAGLASFLGAKGEDGLVAGAAYGLARQHSENQRFTKEKPFSVTLGPNEERYETGAFPINKQLAESPTFHFLGVD